MNIRRTTYKDNPAIKLQLEALGYNLGTSLLVDQLETLCGRWLSSKNVVERIGKLLMLHEGCHRKI